MSEGAIYEWDVKKIATSNPREQIKQLVCAEFEIESSELSGTNRHRLYMDARCAYSYLTRKHLNDTLFRIGMELNKDHSAISNQLRKAEGFIYINDPIVKRIERIERNFLNINK